MAARAEARTADRPPCFGILLAYWAKSLRESLRRDPDLDNHAVVAEQHLWDGRLSEIVAQQLWGTWAQSRAGRQAARQRRKSEPEQARISVLVAPYLAGPASLRTRSPEGETLPPFWVPAILRPDGTLLPDRFRPRHATAGGGVPGVRK